MSLRCFSLSCSSATNLAWWFWRTLLRLVIVLRSLPHATATVFYRSYEPWQSRKCMSMLSPHDPNHMLQP
eukprot:6132434-Amphidinium_carterae.1